MLSYVLAFIIIPLLVLYYVTTRKFSYWKNKKVPYVAPIPLFGNYLEYILLRKCQAKVTQELCLQFRDEPYFGTFFGTEPALMILHPEIIKLVLTKDFYFFNSRELMDYIHKEVITQSLFFQFGDKWKVLRNNLTPLFTSAKMKTMFYLVSDCAKMFEDLLNYETNVTASKILGTKDITIRYTMDAICSCSFGIETGTMSKDAEINQFTTMGHLIIGTSYYRGFKTITRQIWPGIFYGVGMKTFPTNINLFFHKLLTDVFKSREYKSSQRKDFVDLLLDLQKNKVIVGDSVINMKTKRTKQVTLELNDDLLVSQCVIFFAAGFETSANAMSLLIYELAKNFEAQKRVQQEIDNYLMKHNNKLVFDCITELPYLEACISEVLRLYPPLPVITREVVEEYTFQSGLHIPKGLRVHIPVYHLHHDSRYFPNPEKFQPERFIPENVNKINSHVYLPFGGGQRACIGMRFAKMMMIPGLITLLKTYNVEPAPDTPLKLEFETTTLLLQPTSGLPLKITKRFDWEKRVYNKTD